MFAVMLTLLLAASTPPSVTVQTLAGERMVLPRDFTQPVVLVVREIPSPWSFGDDDDDDD